MSIKELYEELNADYDYAYGQFMSEERLAKYLVRLTKEQSYNMLIKAIEDKDIKASFETSHRLKGVIGVFGFTQLFNDVNELTEYLRPQKVTADLKLMKKISLEYDRIISVINSYFEVDND